MEPSPEASCFDVRHLLCVAAVAETGTAVAAAECIGGTPSYIAAQLRAFEQQSGRMKLFRRAARGLEPTDEGQWVLRQIHSALQAGLDFLAAASGLRHARGGELHFGAESASAGVPERTRLVEQFLTENGQLTFHLTEATSAETLCELQSGAIDVALMCVPRARAGYLDSCRVLTVRRSTPHVLIPSWHPLACRSRAPELPDLAGERLAVPPRSADPAFWDRCLAPLAAAGANLVPVPEWNADALVGRVLHNGELTVLPDWLLSRGRTSHPGLVSRPFGNAVCCDDLCIVARAPADGAVAERFLETAVQALALEPDAPGSAAQSSASPWLRLDAHGRRLYREAFSNSSLRTFVKVAQTRSFTQAAAELYSSQPWLSTQIRSLEERLSLKLFDRSSHHVSLTEDGGVLLQQARTILHCAEIVTRELASGPPRPRSPLRLGAPGYTLGLGSRAELIRRFADAGPAMTLQVENGYGAQLQARLRAGRLDAAVLLRPLDEQGLAIMDLEEMVCSTIMIPIGEPCSRLALVSARHLAGLRLATWRRELNPPLFDLLINPLSEAGAVLVPMHGVQAEGIGEAATALGLAWLQGMSDTAVPAGYVRCPLEVPLRMQAVLAARDDGPWPARLERLWRIAAQIRDEQASRAQPAGRETVLPGRVATGARQ
jgi:DNA-binding transcriptional LysR family regulator